MEQHRKRQHDPQISVFSFDYLFPTSDCKIISREEALNSKEEQKRSYVTLLSPLKVEAVVYSLTLPLERETILIIMLSISCWRMSSGLASSGLS